MRIYVELRMFKMYTPGKMRSRAVRNFRDFSTCRKFHDICSFFNLHSQFLQYSNLRQRFLRFFNLRPRFLEPFWFFYLHAPAILTVLSTCAFSNNKKLMVFLTKQRGNKHGFVC